MTTDKRTAVGGMTNLERIAERHSARAAELNAEIKANPVWLDRQFTQCRVCGFPVATSIYHRQTCEIIEDCRRCGASCHYSLEALVPGITEERGRQPDVLEYLHSAAVEATPCPECGATAPVLLNVLNGNYEVLVHCPECGFTSRSAPHELDAA